MQAFVQERSLISRRIDPGNSETDLLIVFSRSAGLNPGRIVNQLTSNPHFESRATRDCKQRFAGVGAAGSSGRGYSGRGRLRDAGGIQKNQRRTIQTYNSNREQVRLKY